MYRHIFKPLIDFLGALLLLPFVLLVIVIFGPAIYFTDRGPIFYNAPRLGQWGRMFRMYKLRSMYMNAPDLRNDDGSTYNADDDPRVMPIGRFLRKTSIDELPQLLNVLRGQMSFVGPRPTVSNTSLDYDRLEGDTKHRYDVKPGITGYAQAYFRNSIPQEQKFHWDAFYAKHLNPVLDMKIIVRTAGAVACRKNINNLQ
jgi:lipopolysaccharide/colanic/teichoic acid biosynthesis glycosyltransferase